ncbi:MAG: LEA type 2 family protein [Candidatus Poribacteria bacterium]
MSVFRVKLLLFLALALSMSSCSTFHSFIKGRVKEPEVDFIDAKIAGLSFNGIDLLFDLKVKNPNKIGIKLAGFDYDLLLNGNSFLTGNQIRGIEIPSLGEETVQLPVNLNFFDIYKTFQNLWDQGLSNYQMKFGFSFEMPVLGAIRIPVSKSGEFPLIKIPKISLQSLNIEKLNITNADMKLKLKVNNPNAFAMILKGGNYQLKLNNQNIFSGIMSDKNIQIGEKSDGIIEMPISLDFISVGKSVYQMLSGNKSIDYNLIGNFNLGTSLPLMEKADLPFEISGKTDLIR